MAPFLNCLNIVSTFSTNVHANTVMSSASGCCLSTSHNHSNEETETSAILVENQAEEHDLSFLRGHLVVEFELWGQRNTSWMCLLVPPPKHFLLIIDIESDLNWIQCAACYDCFKQNGCCYVPKSSQSFMAIIFTVNLTSPNGESEFKKVENVSKRYLEEMWDFVEVGRDFPILLQCIWIGNVMEHSGTSQLIKTSCVWQ
ncbi:Protein ASPARTIC PROTEASE IN GUARD CELL 1 [Bienertia sinuspersici]